MFYVGELLIFMKLCSDIHDNILLLDGHDSVADRISRKQICMLFMDSKLAAECIYGEISVALNQITSKVNLSIKTLKFP